MKTLLFILLSCIAFAGSPLSDSSAVVTVTRVIDGDTFEFVYDSVAWKVRVIGIDCFETRRGQRLTKQAEQAGISPDSALFLGKECKRFADSVLLGRQVVITRIKRNTDKYGRFLRNVYIDSMLYSDLVRKVDFFIY